MQKDLSSFIRNGANNKAKDFANNLFIKIKKIAKSPFLVATKKEGVKATKKNNFCWSSKKKFRKKRMTTKLQALLKKIFFVASLARNKHSIAWLLREGPAPQHW